MKFSIQLILTLVAVLSIHSHAHAQESADSVLIEANHLAEVIGNQQSVASDLARKSNLYLAECIERNRVYRAISQACDNALEKQDLKIARRVVSAYNELNGRVKNLLNSLESIDSSAEYDVAYIRAQIVFENKKLEKIAIDLSKAHDLVMNAKRLENLSPELARKLYDIHLDIQERSSLVKP